MQDSMRAVFEDIGCSPCTAKAMVVDEGIDTLDDLCFLEDGDIEALCKNVKHPGGAAGRNNRGPTKIGLAPKHTNPVGLRVETSLYSLWCSGERSLSNDNKTCSWQRTPKTQQYSKV